MTHVDVQMTDDGAGDGAQEPLIEEVPDEPMEGKPAFFLLIQEASML
jgi:hypothetical protein